VKVTFLQDCSGKAEPIAYGPASTVDVSYEKGFVWSDPNLELKSISHDNTQYICHISSKSHIYYLPLNSISINGKKFYFVSVKEVHSYDVAVIASDKEMAREEAEKIIEKGEAPEPQYDYTLDRDMWTVQSLS
jgi:hypothetical protein